MSRMAESPLNEAARRADAHTAEREGAGRLIEVLRDLSARRAAERVLSECRDMMLGARPLGRVGAWKVIADSNSVELNSGTLRILGLDSDTFEGSAADLLQLVHPQDRRLVQDRIADVLTGDGLSPVDLRVLRADGQVRVLRVSGCVDIGADGELHGAIGYVRDEAEAPPTREASKNVLRKKGPWRPTIVP